MITIVPMQVGVNVRHTNWICVCPECQCEREITYAQKQNIVNEVSSGKCRRCNSSPLSSSQLAALELGRKHHISPRQPFENKWSPLISVFYPVTPETRAKMRASKLGRFGEMANRWDGGKTLERTLLESRPEYKELRRRVFERDDYTCQDCTDRGGSLQLHHVKSWSQFPALRFIESNCVTLCESCHILTPNFGCKALSEVA